MKHLVKTLLCAVICVFMAQSCIEKEYDWDDIDKNGVINIPPVMFGNIDTIYIEGLPEGVIPYIPGGIEIPDWEIAKSDTIRGLFDGDAIKNFFFDGAGTVSIETKVDMYLPVSGISVEIYFNVLDYSGNRIEDVKITNWGLTSAKNQVRAIVIDKQYMKYMENAKDLELTIVIASEGGEIEIEPEYYIFLKEIIVKTGGFHFEL